MWKKFASQAQKISIWDFYGILQATYFSDPVKEKSKMFKEYCQILLDKYYGLTGK